MRLFPCKQTGCQNTVEKRGGHCDVHRANNDRTRDTVRKLYNDPRWRSGVQPRLIAENGLCQRLVNGKRCINLAMLVHHRNSPRERPDLMFAVYDENGISNLICLCRDCHPSSEGTPTWREGVDFTRTEFEIHI